MNNERDGFMKKSRIIIAVLLSAALCGCSKKDNNESLGVTSLTVTSAEESKAQSEPVSSAGTGESSSAGGNTSEPTSDVSVPDGIETFITGMMGEKIYSSEISAVFTNDGSELTAEELTRDNFSAVLCDGFAYLAQPSGISRNSVDNVDVYDSENMRFIDTVAEPISNYTRVNVGDRIGGLTLREAQVNFAGGKEMGLPDIAFVYGTAMFDGELTMTGYISRAAADSYNFMSGDLMFVPCDGEAKFPVMSYSYDSALGYCHAPQYLSSGSDFTWMNEFGFIYLGNASLTTADISGIPNDGSFVKVKLTINNLMISSAVDRSNSIVAEIVDVDTL